MYQEYSVTSYTNTTYMGTTSDFREQLWQNKLGMYVREVGRLMLVREVVQPIIQFICMDGIDDE